MQCKEKEEANAWLRGELQYLRDTISSSTGLYKRKMKLINWLSH